MPAPCQQLSPWKMLKAQLLEELKEKGVPAHSSWTVPELRQIVIETRQADQPKVEENPALKGLSKASLAELIAKAKQLDISMPVKPTRGWLMKMIRDSASTPGETVVCFGKFKGWMFQEVPNQYLDWAIAETEANHNASDDLRRLASWAKQQKEKKGKTTLGERTRSMAMDPEAVAKIPPPSIRHLFDGHASDASWSQVSEPETRGKGGSAKKGYPARKQEISEEEEINLLKSRLEMLEQRKKRPVNMEVQEVED